MKKIFYSLMAVALCSCAQSEVDDNMGATPQPENNNGVTFTVVDNGFVGEDGTRVSYGEYGSANNGAYKATFEDGDKIGVFAIKSSDMAADNTPTAYVVENAMLTLTDGVWKGSIDFQDADLLFAYAPYRENVFERSGKPLFTGAQGSWEVSTGNNRFFVDEYLNQDNGTLEAFKDADWMGAAANITSGQTNITFNMKHMRGMVEVTTDKNVELTDLTLAIGGDNGAQYSFNPFLFATTDTKKVYRILTTEYYQQNQTNTVYATIKDINIVKKYKKTLSQNGAGKCFRMNINYVPPTTITIDAEHSLASILTEQYGTDYATNGKVTSLRLAGTLQGDYDGQQKTCTGDWETLRSLQNLTTLDMYQLTNESIPNKWIWRDAASQNEVYTKLCETLTTLVLPNSLKRIGNNSLQPKTQLTNIDLPVSVTTLDGGAFWGSGALSICIPEDSQLQTIGHGAFQYVKAVYTDSNNANVLKIPASVTSISDYAFANISTMGKVVFQSAEAPTFGGTNIFGSNNTMIYVPDKTIYSGKFPGKMVVVGPILTAAAYKSDVTINYDGKGLPALCDGITGRDDNYWHTDYNTARDYDDWGICVDITLPKDYNNLVVSYTTRNSGAAGAPKRVKIGVSNDGTNYTDVYTVTDLAQEKNFTKILDRITTSDNSTYKYVRFGVLESNNGVAENATASKVYTNLSELTIGEEIWIDSAN